MCGIFAFLLNNKYKLTLEQRKKLLSESIKIQHRGPDNTIFNEYGNSKVFFTFHRLCIIDKMESGNQPLRVNNIALVCNGEIYNYKELIETHHLDVVSGSDCEVIIHLYLKYGIEKTLTLLDGVFAFVLYNIVADEAYIARDPIGVRSLYYGKNFKGDLAIGSEVKSIQNLVNGKVSVFPPGCYYKFKNNETSLDFKRYYDYNYKLSIKHEEMTDDYFLHTMMLKTKHYLTDAVKKRMMSERPVGCLLSGGLDSSLITALVSKYYTKAPLQTFSIGLEGSEDLKYARMVADFLGTHHHEVVVTEKDMLDFIETDIVQIESYDTTTVRASVPMLMLCKYVRENTDVIVIYSGEGSDEASGSYLYFHNAPTPKDFQEECVRLIKDLNRFDVLRCDKSTAGAGLEVRVPFLDKQFLEHYMSVPAEMKVPKDGMEKWFLRKSFEDMGLLPKEVLWRTKDGMSDGCSSKSKPWYSIIQDYVDTIISDEEFELSKLSYTFNPPQIKETLYYRRLFEKHYPSQEHLTPYYWLPKWSGDITNPSGRIIEITEK